MNKQVKFGKIKSTLLSLLFCAIFVFSSGCSSLVKALAREAIDDGKHAKIKNQSFAGHFRDATLEDLAGIQPVIVKNRD